MRNPAAFIASTSFWRFARALSVSGLCAVSLALSKQSKPVPKSSVRASPTPQEGEGAGWRLVFKDGTQDKALDFAFEEVREARLVPVVDFKGRRFAPPVAPAADAATREAEVDGEPKQ